MSILNYIEIAGGVATFVVVCLFVRWRIRVSDTRIKPPSIPAPLTPEQRLQKAISTLNQLGVAYRIRTKDSIYQKENLEPKKQCEK